MGDMRAATLQFVARRRGASTARPAHRTCAAAASPCAMRSWWCTPASSSCAAPRCLPSSPSCAAASCACGAHAIVAVQGPWCGGGRHEGRAGHSKWLEAGCASHRGYEPAAQAQSATEHPLTCCSSAASRAAAACAASLSRSAAAAAAPRCSCSARSSPAARCCAAAPADKSASSRCASALSACRGAAIMRNLTLATPSCRRGGAQACCGMQPKLVQAASPPARVPPLQLQMPAGAPPLHVPRPPGPPRWQRLPVVSSAPAGTRAFGAGWWCWWRNPHMLCQINSSRQSPPASYPCTHYTAVNRP